eukprot:s1487_g12.t1
MHQVEQFPEPGTNQMAVALSLIQTNLEKGSKSPHSDKATSKATRGRKDNLPKSAIPKLREGLFRQWMLSTCTSRHEEILRRKGKLQTRLPVILVGPGRRLLEQDDFSSLQNGFV